MTIANRPITPQANDRIVPLASARSWFILALLCVAQFINVFLFQSVTLVLPAIQNGLHFSSENLQWVTNAYTLAFGGGLLVAGRLADLFGRRRLFLLGLLLCVPGLLASGFATSSLLLIVGRIIQGISCAIVIPAALALLIDTFPQDAQRHRALGIWSAAGPIGGMAGTILGTLLADSFGWPWIFFLNVPFAVVMLLIALKALPDVRERPSSSARVDILGALLSTGGIVLLIAALTQMAHPDGRWLSSPALLAGCSLVVLLLFCFLERRLAHPLVPLRFLLRPQIAGASLVTLMYSAATNTPLFFFTLYMQQVRGSSSFLTGLSFLPTNLALLCGSFLCARIIRWLGAKKVTAISLLMVAAGALLFTRMSVSGNDILWLLPGLVLLGAGLGMAQVAVMAIGTSQLPVSERGLASSLVSMASQIGTALGLALLVLLANLRSSVLTGHPQPSSVELVAGFQWAFSGAIAFAVLSILLSIFMLKRDYTS
ncbi:MFS transporter [Ktedonobacter sp. SOSP1-52]|uniref:MFS transporter n=1 Tax=Ktedonobacter sp. SOSP1-52 TaxID=2778366 RepID=UPI0019153470|nr:MFS transporter [Ktedonobacter sp. SOSP1-52]GHO64388.1 MFS transporter [Ktedonobacter sp. SOSP1-52]